MRISEAKQYVGRRCSVTFRDRNGEQVTRRLHVADIAFVPMYGPYLIGDMEDVSLDQVTSIDTLE